MKLLIILFLIKLYARRNIFKLMSPVTHSSSLDENDIIVPS